MLVRISGGETKLKIPPVIKYPGFVTVSDQDFRTSAIVT